MSTHDSFLQGVFTGNIMALSSATMALSAACNYLSGNATKVVLYGHEKEWIASELARIEEAAAKLRAVLAKNEKVAA